MNFEELKRRLEEVEQRVLRLEALLDEQKIKPSEETKEEEINRIIIETGGIVLE